jgi:carboxypeptidase Taq
MTAQEAVNRLKEIGEDIKIWSGIGSLLGWDQETYMPEKAVPERSKQQAALSSLLHEKITSAEIGRLLDVLGADEDHVRGDDAKCADLGDLDRALIRVAYREYAKETKLPANLVKELSETRSQAQAAWAKARQNNDFGSFRPWLEKIIDLKLREADAYGWQENPYDPLLDGYEPGMKTSEVDQVFTALKADLVPLVKNIAESEQVNNDFLMRHYPAELQEKFGRFVLDKLNYPMDRGRLDVTAHPFTTELGADDIRITTRYLENFFNSSLFGTVHEAGHGLYELGMGDEIRGGILAEGTSLGIHESQSRTWENLVGRSREFWQFFLPHLKQIFPENLEGIDVEAMWKAVNKVEPSFIRVEADEVTYSLHVMLRFELEKQLINKKLAVKDIPEAWNEGMREMLGIIPANDAEGCLQDVHWSFGLFGYFPTYALGNLYGSQFWNAMMKDLPDTYQRMAAGDFSGILGWLRENIHRHGSAKTADELAVDITGETLNAKHFVGYLNDKYSKIYGW